MDSLIDSIDGFPGLQIGGNDRLLQSLQENFFKSLAAQQSTLQPFQITSPPVKVAEVTKADTISSLKNFYSGKAVSGYDLPAAVYNSLQRAQTLYDRATYDRATTSASSPNFTKPATVETLLKETQNITNAKLEFDYTMAATLAVFKAETRTIEGLRMLTSS